MSQIVEREPFGVKAIMVVDVRGRERKKEREQ
jgi:hypothetical protein